MWAWIKFLVIPFILSLVVSSIFAVMASIYRWDLGSWPHVLSDFVGSFLMGMILYRLAPKAKMAAALIYATVAVAMTAYTSYSMAGTTGEMFGETVYYEFHLSRQIASALGFILGIWLARPAKSALDDN